MSEVAALVNKTKSYEKYEELNQKLSESKQKLVSIENELVQQKQQPNFDPKNKSSEFQALEKQVKALKEEVNQLTKEWRKADPHKLHLNREEFEEHLKRRYLVNQSFEIYGGVAGLYDLGPVTTALKANVLNLWRKHFIVEEGILELDCTVLTPSPVFVASGHVARFADWMVKDVVKEECFRADKLLAEFCEKKLEDAKLTAEQVNLYKKTLTEIDGYNGEQLGVKFKELGVKAPETGNDLSDPFPFNLMFSTQIGPSGKIQGFLRPETAQGLFVNFKRCLDYNNGQMPFAVATIGQAFRNEIAPRSGLLRVREFTLAEIEHFVHPDHTQHPKFESIKNIRLPFFSRELQSKGARPGKITVAEAFEQKIISNQTLAYFIARTFLFMRKCGILEDGIRFRQHMPNEMAHYASDCWDCELLTSYGWVECVGLADRSCYDLTAHAKHAKVDLVAYERFDTPVIEKKWVAELNGAKAGKALGANVKVVNQYLSTLSDEQKKQLKEQLSTSPSVELPVSQENKIKVDKELLIVEEKENKVMGRNFTPSVIEPAFGIGRILYCILEHAYWVREEEEKSNAKADKGDKQISRAVLSFTPIVSPYKVALLPLQAHDDFGKIIEKLRAEFSRNGISYKIDDGNQAIGKRYARLDDIGIPFGITIDFDTLTTNTITLRERDSCFQVRVPISDVVRVVQDMVLENSTWDNVKQSYPEHKQTATEKVGKK